MSNRDCELKIVDKGADYCLAVKEINPRFEGIKGFSLDHLEDEPLHEPKC